MPPPSRYITAAKASRIDAELLSPTYGHTLPQLMELAGLCVARAIAVSTPTSASITLVCGPGNNGGDGLVAARHLYHFGYRVAVFYPVRAPRAPFAALLAQLRALDVPVTTALPLPESDVVVDAVFGFGFRVASGGGGLREPWGAVLRAVNEHAGRLVCVDVPSGWHVDGEGKVDGAVRAPDVLVSLTAPKICAEELDRVGRFQHFVGGRFVPPRLCRELEFEVPEYPGTDDIVRIT